MSSFPKRQWPLPSASPCLSELSSIVSCSWSRQSRTLGQQDEISPETEIFFFLKKDVLLMCPLTVHLLRVYKCFVNY